MNKFMGKTALIAGSSTILGSNLCKLLAEESVSNLIILSRSVNKLKNLNLFLKNYSLNLILIPIDLTSFSNVQELSEIIDNKFMSLDILISNISVSCPPTFLTHISSSNWKTVIDININSNWYLLKYCEKILRKSLFPKVLFITSNVFLLHKEFWGPCYISKCALENMIDLYNSEQGKSSLIKVNVMNLGVIRGNSICSSFPGVRGSYWLISELVLRIVLDILMDPSIDGYKISVF